MHFFDRLKNYYISVGKVLRGEAQAASIFPNAADIGDSREEVYMQFLRDHLPRSCHMTRGGFLFNLEGEESPQIDIIVTADQTPRWEFSRSGNAGKAFACVEGTLAVISVKSNLTTGELRAELERSAKIPEKRPLDNRAIPLLKIPNYSDWPFKVIFAFRGSNIGELLAALKSFYAEHEEIVPELRPNIIHVAGGFVIQRTGPEGAATRANERIPPHVFYPIPDPSDAYGLSYVSHEIQKRAMTAQYILFNYDEILNRLPFGA